VRTTVKSSIVYFDRSYVPSLDWTTIEPPPDCVTTMPGVSLSATCAETPTTGIPLY
jgi:hypothetical protein